MLRLDDLSPKAGRAPLHAKSTMSKAHDRFAYKLAMDATGTRSSANSPCERRVLRKLNTRTVETDDPERRAGLMRGGIGETTPSNPTKGSEVYC